MKCKWMILFLSAVFLFGCSSTVEKAENGNGQETPVSEDGEEILSDMWKDFRENMPDDKNMEDDFRNSNYISELKDYLSSDEAFSITREELSKTTGISDVDIIEVSNGEWKARTIYLGPDLINMAVTDVSVANKYVFLQITDGRGNYFCTVCDGGYEFPVDLLAFENDGAYTAVIISRYCAAYPEGVLLKGYTVDEGKIEPANIFDEYAADGLKIEQVENKVLFESDYEDGASFGEILRIGVSVDNKTGDISLTHGDKVFVFGFNGEKYIMNGSDKK